MDKIDDIEQIEFLTKYRLEEKVRNQLKVLKKEVKAHKCSVQKLDVINKMLDVIVNWDFAGANILSEENRKEFNFWYSSKEDNVEN